MAEKKISELDAVATLALDDELAIVDDDVSTTKKATISQIIAMATRTQASLWHDESTVLSGGSLAHSVDAAHRYASYTIQSPGADGDSFEQDFLMQAGTFTLYALGLTSTDRGLLDWYVDDVLVKVGQDWYAGGLARNQIKSFQFAIVGNGLHTLKGVVNGKNGSSSSYVISLTKFFII